jgi:hypothetical protein
VLRWLKDDIELEEKEVPLNKQEAFQASYDIRHLATMLTISGRL